MAVLGGFGGFQALNGGFGLKSVYFKVFNSKWSQNQPIVNFDNYWNRQVGILGDFGSFWGNDFWTKKGILQSNFENFTKTSNYLVEDSENC